MADMTLETLRRVARTDPGRLTPTQKNALLYYRGAPGTKTIDADAPFGFDTPFVRSHPSGLLVSGPGSSRVIDDARHWHLGNSAILACLFVYGDAYKEPQLRFYRGPYMDLQRATPEDDSVAAPLIRRPNGHMTHRAVKQWIAWTRTTDGNAYLAKVRDGGGDLTNNVDGPVIELHPVSPMVMEPVHKKGSPPGPTYYALDIGRSKPVKVPVENVIHFREGIDDRDHLRGLGRVKALAREAGTDEEAEAFVATLLKNLGIPGVVMTPEEDTGLGKDDLELIRDDFHARTTGKNRGKPLVLGSPTRVHQYKADVSMLNLEHVWKHVETRITGVLGTPAILAQLAAGLDAGRYANAETLLEFFTEVRMIPSWLDDSEVWTMGLGRDLGLRDDEFLAYDYPGIRALQQDADDVWERVGKAFERNVLTLQQVHEILDLELPSPALGAMRLADIQASVSVLPLLTSGRKALTVKRRDEYAELLAGELGDIEPELETDMRRYLTDERDRALAAVGGR